MIPDTLQGWNLGAITKILEQGGYESQLFDFKVTLPQDDKGKARLRKTCAAFANSGGGFLVFGVSDDRRLPPAQRLVGIETAKDFMEHFGNYPSGCQPQILWEGQNPPIPIEGGRCIPVVQILPSSTLPHATMEGDISFPKRTNKGNESMSYEEVRMMFLNHYEKRLKLELLRAEIVQAEMDAGNLSSPVNDFMPFTIELKVIDTVLADTYSITCKSRELLQALKEFRSKARYINTRKTLDAQRLTNPQLVAKDILESHNYTMLMQGQDLQRIAKDVLRELDKILK